MKYKNKGYYVASPSVNGLFFSKDYLIDSWKAILMSNSNKLHNKVGIGLFYQPSKIDGFFIFEGIYYRRKAR